VSAFQECFPPLDPRWRPVTETGIRVELFDGLVRLSGRVDLTLGQPAGAAPRKVILDLKTGGPASYHRDDLRFYGLIETIRMGVPPRALATYYLDAARVEVEDVTPAVLDAALARTVDGTRKLVEVLRAQRAAMVSPGALCGWCPIRSDCSEGTAHWNERSAWR
jgi:RecB family exonuclease